MNDKVLIQNEAQPDKGKSAMNPAYTTVSPPRASPRPHYFSKGVTREDGVFASVKQNFETQSVFTNDSTDKQAPTLQTPSFKEILTLKGARRGKVQPLEIDTVASAHYEGKKNRYPPENGTLTTETDGGTLKKRGGDHPYFHKNNITVSNRKGNLMFNSVGERARLRTSNMKSPTYRNKDRPTEDTTLANSVNFNHPPSKNLEKVKDSIFSRLTTPSYRNIASREMTKESIGEYIGKLLTPKPKGGVIRPSYHAPPELVSLVPKIRRQRNNPLDAGVTNLLVFKEQEKRKTQPSASSPTKKPEKIKSRQPSTINPSDLLTLPPNRKQLDTLETGLESDPSSNTRYRDLMKQQEKRNHLIKNTQAINKRVRDKFNKELKTQSLKQMVEHEIEEEQLNQMSMRVRRQVMQSSSHQVNQTLSSSVSRVISDTSREEINVQGDYCLLKDSPIQKKLSFFDHQPVILGSGERILPQGSGEPSRNNLPLAYSLSFKGSGEHSRDITSPGSKGDTYANAKREEREKQEFRRMATKVLKKIREKKQQRNKKKSSVKNESMEQSAIDLSLDEGGRIDKRKQIHNVLERRRNKPQMDPDIYLSPKLESYFQMTDEVIQKKHLEEERRRIEEEQQKMNIQAESPNKKRVKLHLEDQQRDSRVMDFESHANSKANIASSKDVGKSPMKTTDSKKDARDFTSSISEIEGVNKQLSPRRSPQIKASTIEGGQMRARKAKENFHQAKKRSQIEQLKLRDLNSDQQKLIFSKGHLAAFTSGPMQTKEMKKGTGNFLSPKEDLKAVSLKQFMTNLSNQQKGIVPPKPKPQFNIAHLEHLKLHFTSTNPPSKVSSLQPTTRNGDIPTTFRSGNSIFQSSVPPGSIIKSPPQKDPKPFGQNDSLQQAQREVMFTPITHRLSDQVNTGYMQAYSRQIESLSQYPQTVIPQMSIQETSNMTKAATDEDNLDQGHGAHSPEKLKLQKIDVDSGQNSSTVKNRGWSPARPEAIANQFRSLNDSIHVQDFMGENNSSGSRIRHSPNLKLNLNEQLKYRPNMPAPYQSYRFVQQLDSIKKLGRQSLDDKLPNDHLPRDIRATGEDNYDSMLSAMNSSIDRFNIKSVGSSVEKLTETAKKEKLTERIWNRDTCVSEVLQVLASEEERENSDLLFSLIQQQVASEKISEQEALMKVLGKSKMLFQISPLTLMENHFLEVTSDLLDSELTKFELSTMTEPSTDLRIDTEMSTARGGAGAVRKIDTEMLRKKMQNTKHKVKEALYELKHLLQNKDGMYVNIEISNAEFEHEPVTEVELLPNVNYFFRLPIPAKTFSPVMLKFTALNEQRQSLPQSNLTLFGSFHHSLPNLTHTEVHLKNPTKLLIYDRDQLKEFKDDDTYYMSMHTVHPTGMTLLIKCIMKNKEILNQKKKRKTKKDQGVEDKTFGTSSSHNLLEKDSTHNSQSDENLIQSFQPQRKDVPGGHKMNLKEVQDKLKSLVKITMSEELSRKQIMDKMEYLKRKRRVINFLKMQFGSQNPFTKEPKPQCVSDLKNLTYDYRQLNLDYKIVENIQNLQKKKEISERKAAMNTIRDFKTQDALQRKRDLDLEVRIKSLNSIQRWDVFRERRDVAIKNYAQMKKRIYAVRMINRQIFLMQLIRKFSENYVFLRDRIRSRNKIMFYLKLTMVSYKKRRDKLGVDIEDRNRKSIRSSVTFQTCCLDRISRKKAKRAVLAFLMELQYRQAIKSRFDNVFHRIVFIQRRFKNQISITQSKVEALKMLWKKEEAQIRLMAQKKKTNFELQKFVLQIANVSEEIKDACFRRYVGACKVKHALAFFQWRDKYSVKSNAGLLNAIFLNRIATLKRQSKLKKEILSTNSEQVAKLADARIIEEELSGRRESTTRKQVDKRDSSRPATDTPITELTSENIIRIKSLKRTLSKQISIQDNGEILASLEADIANASLIHSFEEINMMDPFPGTNSNISSKRETKRGKDKESDNNSTLSQNLFFASSKNTSNQTSTASLHKGKHSHRNSLLEVEHIKDLVYDEKKFREDAPPSMIFVPSKVVMRKIMRVCASVNDFSDLYYFF